MIEDSVLTLMVFLPLAGAAVILCLPGRAHTLIRWTAAAATVPTLLLAGWLLAHFDPQVTEPQFVQKERSTPGDDS